MDLTGLDELPIVHLNLTHKEQSGKEGQEMWDYLYNLDWEEYTPDWRAKQIYEKAMKRKCSNPCAEAHDKNMDEPVANKISIKAITFSPKTGTPWKDLRQRLSRYLNSKSHNVGKAFGCVEERQDGTPHIHMIVKSNGQGYLKRIHAETSNKKQATDFQDARKGWMNYIKKEETKLSPEEVGKPYFIYEKNFIKWVSDISSVDNWFEL